MLPFNPTAAALELVLIIGGLLGGLGAVRSVLIGTPGGVSAEVGCVVGGGRDEVVLDVVRGLCPCRMTR